jgi:uncharacterized protein (DUF58 family)
MKRSTYSVSSYFLIPLVIAFVAVVAFAATALRSADLAGASGAALALILTLRLVGSVGHHRLKAHITTSGERFFPGDCLAVEAEIHNGKIIPVWLRADLRLPKAFAPKQGPSPSHATLGSYKTRTATWEYIAQSRGAYTLGPLVLETSDPLNLYRRETPVPYDGELLVYPRIRPLDQIPLPFLDYFGIHPAKGIIEDPAWYEGTREYSGNRPARNIHWKASARLDSLQEKIFAPTSHQKIFFVFSGRGYGPGQDSAGFEKALETIASLAAAFVQGGADVGLASDRTCPGTFPFLPLGRGPEHLGKLLEILARSTVEEGRPAAQLIGTTGIRGASIIVVSRTADERTKRFFSLPATRRDRILFLFQAETEKSGDYPSLEFSALFDGESETVFAAAQEASP